MTPELDLAGAAAPPRVNGELAFDEPWQGRLFATTMALCERGLLSFEDFRQHLIERIASVPDRYWESWQDALEDVLATHGVCGRDELDERARRFARHD